MVCGARKTDDAARESASNMMRGKEQKNFESSYGRLKVMMMKISHGLKGEDVIRYNNLKAAGYIDDPKYLFVPYIAEKKVEDMIYHKVKNNY